MSIEGRIKLVEAIGRKYTKSRSEINFDPFTDANDDYAVLEWMRENWQGKDGHHGHWHQAAQSLWWRWDEYDVIVPYQIGDYAKAALNALEGDDNE